MTQIAKPQRVELLMSRLYNNFSGYISNYNFDISNKNFCPGYGEILYQGILTIINQLELVEEDIFIDLGSGIGKACIQFLFSSVIKKSIGIELEENRYSISINILNILKNKKILPNEFDLEFYNQNIVDFDFSLGNIIYVGSLCFSKKLLDIISEKLNNTSNIKYVIIFNKLPNTDLVLYKEIIVPCSWKKNEIIYIYTK